MAIETGSKIGVLPENPNGAAAGEKPSVLTRYAGELVTHATFFSHRPESELEGKLAERGASLDEIAEIKSQAADITRQLGGEEIVNTARAIDRKPKESSK